MFYYVSTFLIRQTSRIFLLVWATATLAQSPLPIKKQEIELPPGAFDNVPVYGPSPQSFERAGDKAFAAGDFYAALRYYQHALVVLSDNHALLFKFAEAARNFGAYETAGEAYREVVGLDVDKKFPTAIFWLAEMEKMRGKYHEAYQYFQQFVNTPTATDKTLTDMAILEMDECLWALEKLNAPASASVVLERLPDAINTTQSEFGAVQRGDTLFYSSFREGAWRDKHFPPRPIIKIMESKEGHAPQFSALNHSQRHTAHTAFSPDNQWMIYNLCDYVGESEVRCELYLSRRHQHEWLTGVRLPDIINYPNYTATQPNFGTDPNGSLVLYFVSDRPGGQGNLDIWRSKLSDDGIFSAPENLSEINTPQNDITPYFHSKTQTLYFSTTGRRSMGGYDIYKSLLKAHTFETPEHLEVPFNSSYHDVYFSMQGDDWAYFSSNRRGSSPISDDACCYDIYKATYLELKLQSIAFSKLSGLPLDEVVFSLRERQSVNPPVTQFSGDRNEGEFDVKRNKTYEIIATREGYRPDTLVLETSDLPLDRKFVAKLYLEPSDFALNVRTFNQFYKSPLTGVKIKLIEMKDKVPVSARDEKNTEETNEADLSVRLETQYMIIGQKDGFFPDTVMLGASELKAGVRMTKDLFLTPSSLNNFLPIALYFDNDHPDPRTRRETTSIAYDETYHQYIARKQHFIDEFTQNMSAEKRLEATQKLNNFFTYDVTGGYLKLDHFTENLGLFLENSYKVEIMVKGFASPLANADYNLALTKRRIASVLNYFRKAEGGIFNPYLFSGQLQVVNMPFGETAASKDVDDNPRNRRLSIYSVEASRERRAEILEIRLVKQFKN